MTAEGRSQPETGRADLKSLRIGLVSSHTELAKAAEAMLRRRYDWAETAEAETLVALGGDGFMLQTLHEMLSRGRVCPVFGMNRGTVGFLMNDWRIDALIERLLESRGLAGRNG